VVNGAFDGDVVMCMGAGSIGSVPAMIIESCVAKTVLKVVGA
jgi:hypothetical protein